MGASDGRIYWYPSRAPGSSVEEIDLGRRWGDIAPVGRVRDRRVVQGLTGQVEAHDFGGPMRLRIYVDRFVEPELAMAFLALEEHLKAGGVIGVAENHSKAWAGFVEGVPVIRGRGTSAKPLLVKTSRSFWNDSGTLAADDGVRLSSGIPETLADEGIVSSFSASGKQVTLAMDEGVRFRFEQQPVLVTHHRYWPCLRLPAEEQERNSQSYLSADRGVTWTWDITLEEALDVIVDYRRRGDDALRNPGGG